MRLFIIVITCVSASWSRADVTSDFARASIRHGLAVSARVLERFPPDRYAYVMVGRSPAVLSAYFDELAARGPARGVVKLDLPLSGLGGYAFNYRTYDALLHEHFDRFIPAADRAGPRRLLFVDYAATGRSFGRLADLLGRYGRARGISKRLEVLALRIDPRVPTLQAPPPGLPDLVGPSAGLAVHELELSLDEWLVFQTSRFKDYAPYGKFSFRSVEADVARSVLDRENRAPVRLTLDDVNPAHPNPEFLALRTAIHLILTADACEQKMRVLPPPPWDSAGYGLSRAAESP